MRRNDILFTYNFYSNEGNISQLNITLAVYFVQFIGCILFGLFIFDFNPDFYLGFNEETLSYIVIFFVSALFVFYIPMQRIFILALYSGLIKKVNFSNVSIQLECVLGKKLEIRKYEILTGFDDYAGMYRFLWLKGIKYIKAVADSEADSVFFTIKDLGTGRYYLFLADKELLNDPDWLNLDREELKENRILS